MLKYPISTLLYLAKINIKDKIQDALKLHNNIDIRLTITVKDKDGKIIKVHKQKSHSFVANFLNILGNQFYNIYNNNNAIYNVTNTSGSEGEMNYAMNMNDSSNDSTYGIIIGTGKTAPAPGDYEMESQITNGTGSGQMQYGSHTFNPSSGTVNISSSTSSFQISRQFTNNSGSSITVSEVGIIINAPFTNGTVVQVLIVHDLLSSPITVANLSVLQITYTFSVTT